MWASEDGAETMALNPWNVGGVPQHGGGGWSLGGGAGGGMAAAGSTRGPGGYSGGRGGPQGGGRGAPSWDMSNGGPTNGAPAGGWQQHMPPGQWPVPPAPPGGMPPVNLATAPWQPAPPHIPQQPTKLLQWGLPQGYVDPMKKHMNPVPMRNTPIQRFDQQQQQPPSWNGIKPSDQGAPWDTGLAGGHEPKEWGMPMNNQSRAGWQAGPSSGQNNTNTWNSGTSKEWQNPQGRHDLVNTNLWQQPATPQQPMLVQQGSWNQNAGMPQVDQSRLQYEMDPQTPGPWVAPIATELNNDMMWHDPNPKQRKVQRDIGTQSWGDPNSQHMRFQEIRRWKDADGPEYQCATGPPAGNDWTQLSFSNSATVSPPGVGGWGDVPQGGNTGAPSSSLHGIGDRDLPGSDRGWGPTTGWGGDMTRPQDSPDISSNPNPVNGSGLMEGAASAAAVAVASGPSNARPADISMLTQQIAEQLRIAVSKGLIRMEILSQPLPQEKLILLNTLLQRLPRLEQAQQEIEHIRNSPHNPSQQHEIDRLTREIETLKLEISNLQRAISPGGAAPAPVQNPASAPGAVSSRLMQWKGKSTASTDDKNHDPINSLMGALNLDDKPPGDWSQGGLDWSPPGSTSAVLPGGDDVTVRSQHSDSPANPLGLSSTEDGPQEFVPGKKWEWRDPNKVAEDPNATPGSLKPNPLIAPPTFGQDAAFNGWNGISTATAPGAELWNKSQPTWFCMQLKGANDKQMVAHLERIVGPVMQSLVPPPGAVLIARFQENTKAEVIFRRLQQEFGSNVKALTQQELEAQQYGKALSAWDSLAPQWSDAGTSDPF